MVMSVMVSSTVPSKSKIRLRIISLNHEPFGIEQAGGEEDEQAGEEQVHADRDTHEEVTDGTRRHEDVHAYGDVKERDKGPE